jgi:hypothetical protein
VVVGPLRRELELAGLGSDKGGAVGDQRVGKASRIHLVQDPGVGSHRCRCHGTNLGPTTDSFRTENPVVYNGILDR